MAYLDIDNLYKNQDILLFKECYAMEKIHGSSARISWKINIESNESKIEQLNFSPGGINYDIFRKLFNREDLVEKFRRLNLPEIIFFGEVYGGRIQGMRETYGPAIQFVVFEVKIGQSWLCVPDACKLAMDFGFDFVPYGKIPTTIEAINAERDRHSIQAIKNGMGPGKKREGIVLRPLIEVRKNNGERIIAKHKTEEFQETKTSRSVNGAKLKILTEANAIADEWVTEMRLTHILDNFPSASIVDTGNIIKAMTADIEKEAKGEILSSKEAKIKIGQKTAIMFKRRIGVVGKKK